jgi:uncharacterized membrane protein
MTRSIKTIACVAAVISAALSTAALATPWSEPLYDYIYYSDATKTVQVGYHVGVCYNGYAGVAEFATGTMTSHYELIRTGTCTSNGTIHQ